jgi:hypothetical protein
LNELLEKAGKHRCRNEHDCLDYQTRDDSAAAADDPDYLSHVVNASLAAAAERIAAYRTAKANGGISEESIAEFAWMKAVIDVLAAQYKEKGQFEFQYDENKGEYVVSFIDADRSRSFKVKTGILAGSRYTLAAAKADRVADPEALYQEFIYKSYPAGRREDLVEDLSVILTALEGGGEGRSALLGEFRREIEARCHHEGGV